MASRPFDSDPTASVPVRRALVFAAGLGTRLRPLTDNMPKALVPVGGKPLLWHILMKLKAAGYSEIVINVHHFPDQIIDYISSQLCGDFAGLHISISHERRLLRGTGGGIEYARRFLDNGTQAFLAHNVDVLTNLSLEWLEGQADPRALSTLVVSERETNRYFLFDETMRLVGWTNVSTGEVRSPYCEDMSQMAEMLPPTLQSPAAPNGVLDLSRCRKLAFAGIHLINPRIFAVLESMYFGNCFSITDFYVSVCAEYPIYGVVPADFRFMDIGKIATLPAAEAFLAGL